MKSLQDTYAPGAVCFGCGPANDKGLQLKSFVEGDTIVAEFQPASHHLAFEEVLCGGIIGTLLDCHCNWTAAYHLMKAASAEAVPATVTAEYTITMRHPTPLVKPVRLVAVPTRVEGRKVVVEGHLEVEGRTTASCRGTFVAVKAGHPAFFRW